MPLTVSRSLRLPLVVLVALVVSDCGGASPEQQLLTNFFRASRVRDNATLSNISTVQFNPRTDGTVQDFEVTNVRTEQRRTLQIDQTLNEVEEAKTAEAEFAKRKKAYQDANMPALQRVWLLRQLLHPLNVIDSMEFLLDKISRTETNQEFLESMHQ